MWPSQERFVATQKLQLSQTLGREWTFFKDKTHMQIHMMEENKYIHKKIEVAKI
jgi:hypothetical protein